jgi:hypothetical protein
MSKLRSIAFTLAATVLLPGGGIEAPHPVTVDAHDPAQVEMVDWALGRFAEAGFDLPPLAIRFPGRDLALCDGSQGRVYPDRDPIEIRLCWNDEFILLHELAHVWEVLNVPADKHVPFMQMRDGVLSWASRDVAWVERGREHAASVIAWGLLEEPHPVPGMYPNDPDSLVAAFQHLTDRDPLHDGGQPIQVPDRSFFDGRSNPPRASGR